MKPVLQTAALFAVLVTFDVGRYFFLPDVGLLRKKYPETTAFMHYRQSQWEREGRKKKVQVHPVPLTRISPYLSSAVLIAEDDKFWEHNGFDFEAMEHALERNIREKQFVSGASTVTQQLARNLYLSPSKNPVRKLKEAILAWRIERELSKKRILEIYLNVIEWGDGIFGIEAAARHYFARSARVLTAREACRLAAVLPNPLRYSPKGSSRFIERRAQRICRIMWQRKVLGFDPARPEGSRFPWPFHELMTISFMQSGHLPLLSKRIVLYPRRRITVFPQPGQRVSWCEPDT